MSAIKVITSLTTLTLEEHQRQKVIALVSSDRLPRLDFQWTDADGVTLNLTGITPRLHLRTTGNTKRLNPTANTMTIDDVVNGKAHYSFTATDLATPGDLEGELVLDYGATGTWTLPEVLRFTNRPRF